MISKQKAETKMTVKGPTVIDRLKDWIRRLTGKIQHIKNRDTSQFPKESSK
jgi:hypothetical protein